jgi:hypothetical protein
VDELLPTCACGCGRQVARPHQTYLFRHYAGAARKHAEREKRLHEADARGELDTPTTVRCGRCDWRVETTARDAAEVFREHVCAAA